MSVIRRLAPDTCPNCGAKDSLFIAQDGQLSCNLCGQVVEDETNETESAPISPFDKRQLKPTYGIEHPDKLNSWARAAYHTAQDHINRQEWDDALKALYRALESERDFLDAHLWIARLEDDPEVKREHLSSILAQYPSHLEATRLMMVLNGQLTEEEAARSQDIYHEPEQRAAAAPVSVEHETLACPQCGGGLTVNYEAGEVHCFYCGYDGVLEKQPSAQSGGPQLLTMALLERRGQEVEWVIGERLLGCENCGAERTIVGKMASACPFCGSRQVVEKDALNSFRQPDGIIPFSVKPAEAKRAIHDALNAPMEKLKGFFVNNRVERAMMNGVYLPYWLFDSVVQATVTLQERESSSSYRSYGNPSRMPMRQQHTDMMNNVPVAAVQSPAPSILARLWPYETEGIVPYQPEYLAQHSAELYTLDFDKASLEARGTISDRVRKRQTQLNNTQSMQVTNVSVLISSMSFRLVLLPVWVITMLEEDGDIRVGYVNGQDGRATLTRARKPD